MNPPAGGYKSPPAYGINLIVTTNDNGQQFFVQCFKGNAPGFGVVTEFRLSSHTAKIKAGSECPARTLDVLLNYDGATLSTKDLTIEVPRGKIYIPLETIDTIKKE
jgi:hypothetical protein